MDIRQKEPASPTYESVREAVRGLSELSWDFHTVPWRNLLLIPDAPESTNWRIRSEERKEALAVARSIVRWQLGLDELAADEVERLRERWSNMLLPALDESTVDELWSDIVRGVRR